MSATEFQRIARLAKLFAEQAAPGVAVAIGDDAAVLDSPEGGKIVWTVDAQVEGVHFRRDLVSWEDEGWRSFMAAASDLAAMGATPWCALSSLVLPRDVSDADLDALARGQADAARAVGAPIVGGNLARGDTASITTTLLGTCARALARTANEGDAIWIAGDVGLAAAGLAALEAKLDEGDADVARAILAWRRPTARVAEGRAIAGVARGAVDVSDGLAQDLAHVARGAGLCAVIEEEALRAHLDRAPSLEAVATRLGATAMELALHGGEDYALVAASDAPLAPHGFARLGRFEKRGALVVALEDARGAVRPVDARGFDHFA
jgi:thiamine-monophosphate kinase